MNRSGPRQASAISEIRRPEVLVASSASSGTRGEISAKNARLASSFSTMFSTTRAASEKSSLSVVIRMRASRASDASWVSSPSRTKLSWFRAISARARSRPDALRFQSTVSHPAWA